MGRTEAPSMIAEQRSLIEDLAHSNQEYIRDFERLKLRMDGPAGDRVDDASNSRVVERESSNTTRPSSEVPTSQFERINSTIWGTSPQDNENARGIESKELTTAMRRSPKAQSCLTGTLTTPPNANINNVFINTGAQANLAMPSVQERGIPTTEAPMGFEQEVLFKQLEHYSMLIKNLLKEVDEAQYKITFKSRLRMKGGIAGLHEGERREFEKTWGCTALQSAEQRLDSLAEGLEELPRINRYGASFTSTRSSRYTAHSTDTSQVIDAAYPWLSHQSDSSSRGTKNSAMPGISSSLPMGIDFSTTYITPERPRNDPPNDQPFGMPVKRTKRTLAARKSRTRRTEETEQPHEQKDGTGEGGADATTQPDTPSISASSRPQFGGPLSVAEYEEIPYRLEAVVDVRAPLTLIHVHSNVLLLFYRKAIARYLIATSVILIFLRILISRNFWRMMRVLAKDAALQRFSVTGSCQPVQLAKRPYRARNALYFRTVVNYQRRLETRARGRCPPPRHVLLRYTIEVLYCLAKEETPVHLLASSTHKAPNHSSAKANQMIRKWIVSNH